MKPWIVRSAISAGLVLSALVGQTATAQAAPAPRGADVWTTTLKDLAGQCLTIENGSLRNNARAKVSNCDEGLDNQFFELAPVLHGGLPAWEVRAKHSGRCLSFTNTWDVVQTWCSDDASQRWEFTPSGNGFWLRPMAVLACAHSGSGGQLAFGTCGGRPDWLWYPTK
ncbi:RICIN domain-containing protein [Streptomyces sp. NC-S4]